MSGNQAFSEFKILRCYDTLVNVYFFFFPSLFLLSFEFEYFTISRMACIRKRKSNGFISSSFVLEARRIFSKIRSIFKGIREVTIGI